jgi:hypothetical protein
VRLHHCKIRGVFVRSGDLLFAHSFVMDILFAQHVVQNLIFLISREKGCGSQRVRDAKLNGITEVQAHLSPFLNVTTLIMNTRVSLPDGFRAYPCSGSSHMMLYEISSHHISPRVKSENQGPPLR